MLSAMRLGGSISSKTVVRMAGEWLQADEGDLASRDLRK